MWHWSDSRKPAVRADADWKEVLCIAQLTSRSFLESGFFFLHLSPLCPGVSLRLPLWIYRSALPWSCCYICSRNDLFITNSLSRREWGPETPQTWGSSMGEFLIMLLELSKEVWVGGRPFRWMDGGQGTLRPPLLLFCCYLGGWGGEGVAHSLMVWTVVEPAMCI